MPTLLESSQRCEARAASRSPRRLAPTSPKSTIEDISLKAVRVHDQIYGTHEVSDAVLVAVLRSSGFRRLLSVTQHGTPALTGWSAEVSRGEHMIGAMLLVRQAGGSVDEQVAALVHDVTHRAFSHIVDVAFGENGESLHEVGVKAFLEKTDLPNCLGEDWLRFFDESCWPLLEQPSPALCADRGDYEPRDMFSLKLVEQDFASRYFEAVTSTLDGRMALRSLGIAKEFCLATLTLDRMYYSHPANLGMYHMTAKCFRHAVKHGLLKLESFDSSSCRTLWSRLQASDDPEVQTWLAHIESEGALRRARSTQSHFFLVQSGRACEGADIVARGVMLKPRFVDPLVLSEAGRRVSEVDPSVHEAIELHKRWPGFPVDICFDDAPRELHARYITGAPPPREAC